MADIVKAHLPVSQNHRISRVGRDPQRSLSPTPCRAHNHSQGTLRAKNITLFKSSPFHVVTMDLNLTYATGLSFFFFLNSS